MSPARHRVKAVVPVMEARNYVGFNEPYNESQLRL